MNKDIKHKIMKHGKIYIIQLFKQIINQEINK